MKHPRTKLRVLLISGSYPNLSQSYITTEVKHLSSEFDISIISLRLPNYPDPEPYPYQYVADSQALVEAVRAINPDVIHSHWLTHAKEVASVATRLNVPFTFRAHSFDTLLPHGSSTLPAHLDGLGRALNTDLFLGMLAFPFSRQVLETAGVPATKIIDCGPVVDFAPFYDRSPNRPGAINLGACHAKKKMEDFIRLARRLPGMKFDLYSIGHQTDEIAELNRLSGSPVTMCKPVRLVDMPAVYKEHQWMVYTACPIQRSVGWPIAIAEAMASGLGACMPNIRDDVRDYVGEAGYLYNDVEELVDVLSMPLPAARREAGFEQARKWDFSNQRALLTDMWYAI